MLEINGYRVPVEVKDTKKSAFSQSTGITNEESENSKIDERDLLMETDESELFGKQKAQSAKSFERRFRKQFVKKLTVLEEECEENEGKAGEEVEINKEGIVAL